MRAAGILVLALLPLAGCFDSTDPETVDAASSDDGSASVPNAQAAASSTSTPDGSGVTRTTVPFNAEGSTAPGGAVCSPVGGCQGSTLPGGESYFETDLDGVLDAADLTLTWTATSPATDQLILGIAFTNADGEPDWLTAQGSSPLTLSLAGIGIPAGDVGGIYVNAFQCRGAAVVFACVSLDQAFAIEGTLTTTSA